MTSSNSELLEGAPPSVNMGDNIPNSAAQGWAERVGFAPLASAFSEIGVRGQVFRASGDFANDDALDPRFSSAPFGRDEGWQLREDWATAAGILRSDTLASNDGTGWETDGNRHRPGHAGGVDLVMPANLGAEQILSGNDDLMDFKTVYRILNRVGFGHGKVSYTDAGVLVVKSGYTFQDESSEYRFWYHDESGNKYRVLALDSDGKLERMGETSQVYSASAAVAVWTIVKLAGASQSPSANDERPYVPTVEVTSAVTDSARGITTAAIGSGGAYGRIAEKGYFRTTLDFSAGSAGDDIYHTAAGVPTLTDTGSPVIGEVIEATASAVCYFDFSRAIAFGTSLTNPMDSKGDFIKGGASGAATKEDFPTSGDDIRKQIIGVNAAGDDIEFTHVPVDRNLLFTWVDADTIRLEVGAYVQVVDQPIDVTPERQVVPITTNLDLDFTASGAGGLQASLTRTADTVYYVFLITEADGANPALFAVASDVPAAMTLPGSYVKCSLEPVYAVYNNASNDIEEFINFGHSGEHTMFRQRINVLNDGGATVSTNVDFSKCIPTIAGRMTCDFQVNNTSATQRLCSYRNWNGNTVYAVTSSASEGSKQNCVLVDVGSGATLSTLMSYNWNGSVSGANAYIWVRGWTREFRSASRR